MYLFSGLSGRIVHITFCIDTTGDEGEMALDVPVLFYGKVSNRKGKNKKELKTIN